MSLGTASKTTPNTIKGTKKNVLPDFYDKENKPIKNGWRDKVIKKRLNDATQKQDASGGLDE